MRIDDFLRTVVTSPEGNFCLASKTASAWSESWFSWPNDQGRILDAAIEAAKHSNVYFSAHLFSEPRSQKQYALPSRTVQADLDNAEVATIPVAPTVLVQTSPGRHQGYWLLDKPQPPERLEQLARRVAYGVQDCDRTGWTAGHKVRLPHTYNLKYPKPHLIEVTRIALRELNPDIFNIFPEYIDDLQTALAEVDWINSPAIELDTDPIELLASLKGQINSKAYSQFDKVARDRSAALWLLMCEAFKASCTRDQVYWLAVNSANNKFDERRYNGIRDLRKDVLRAEAYVATKQLDLKAVIMDLRQTGKGDLLAERRKKMAEVVINHMRAVGEFINTKGGVLWYLRRDTGRPLPIDAGNGMLNAYLGNVFGLNHTEQECRYVVQELINYTSSLPDSDDLRTLSYYDTFRKKLLIHTGGRDVWHVDQHGVEVHPNGYGNVVFEWNPVGEIFARDTAPAEPWYNLLFEGCLHNVVGLERDEAIAVLRSWFLFLLFRNLATTKPILALLGQPGSSKTTTAKLLYRLIYGRHKSVSALGTETDFNLEIAHNSFIVFDNLDTWTRWLPDSLAASTSTTTVATRKLWTNSDMIYHTRNAMVGITAHNPKFMREDVTDRLLVILYQRLTEFRSESEILERISAMRNELWAGIVADVQNVMATPMPPHGDTPQFRIEDFARLGLWFARAVSPLMEARFRSAISKIAGRQRSFNLEEDQVLVAALKRYVEKQEKLAKPPAYVPIGTLWERLSELATDQHEFQKQYKGARALYSKLWVAQNTLRTLFDVDWKDDAGIGARTWRIAPKEEATNGS